MATRTTPLSSRCDLQFVATATDSSVKVLVSLSAKILLPMLHSLDLSVLDRSRVVLEWRFGRDERLPEEITDLPQLEHLICASLSDISGMSDDEFDVLTELLLSDYEITLRLSRGRHLKAAPVPMRIPTPVPTPSPEPMPMPEPVVSYELFVQSDEDDDDDDKESAAAMHTTNADRADKASIQDDKECVAAMPTNADLADSASIMADGKKKRPTSRKGLHEKQEQVVRAVNDLYRLDIRAPPSHLVANLVGYAGANSTPFPSIIRDLKAKGMLLNTKGIVLPSDPPPIVWTTTARLNAHLASMVARITRRSGPSECTFKILNLLRDGAVRSRAAIATALSYKNANSQPLASIISAMIKLNMITTSGSLLGLSKVLLTTTLADTATTTTTTTSATRCHHHDHPSSRRTVPVAADNVRLKIESSSESSEMTDDGLFVDLCGTKVKEEKVATMVYDQSSSSSSLSSSQNDLVAI